MAKGDTKTNQYLDIAANGTRADLPSDTCCETRTQTLIRGVAERIMDVEDEVERLENNPDVVDIVDTYADLQNYPTSGLTDKDIIRVIADETKGGLSSYYRWNSPNPGWNFVGVIPGGDGVKELSSADYNYPTESPDRVALWLLDNGLYTAPAGVMVAASTTSYPWYNTSDKTILVGGSDTVKGIYTFLNGKTDVVATQVSDGTEADEYTLLKSNQVLQATGQSTTDTMSQKAITDAIAGAGSTYTAGDGIDIANDVIKATNTGKARVLTTDDYNWPTNNPDGVALFNLPAGVYGSNDSNVKLYFASGSSATSGLAVVGENNDNHYRTIWLAEWDNSGVSERCLRIVLVREETGVLAEQRHVLVSSNVVDNLTSALSTSPLSANQGKVLKDLVDSLAIRASGAPTTSTVGSVGTLYEDTTNGKLYQCTDTTGGSYTWVEVGAGGSGGGVIELTSADYDYPTNNPDGVALWKLPAGVYVARAGVKRYSDNSSDSTTGGTIIVGEPTSANGPVQITFLYGTTSGTNFNMRSVNSQTGAVYGSVVYMPDITQSTGTSTTSVMSQNAVTSMVFADPSTKRKVQIGSNANASGSSSVAIGGLNTTASGVGSVVLGQQARATAQASVAFAYGAATTQGEFNIGTGDNWTTGGYNNSAYRLLTGLHAGVNAHDAVNKGQLDTAIINGGTTAPTTATVGAVGTLYSYVDTTGTPTPHMMVCTVADTVTPSYTWVEIGVIGA